MATPSRMPQSTVRNDGAGPYAVFVCEKCRREFRSQPAKPDNSQIKELGEQTVGNLLRNIPVLGETMANTATTAVDSLAQSLTQAGTEAMGGLLHNIPIFGDAMANTVAAADPRRAQTLTPQQLNLAWQEVQSNFRECPTCRQIVCTADFDEASGVCKDHRGQPGAAAAGAAAAPTGSYGYGYGDSPSAPAAATGSYGYGYDSTPNAPASAPTPAAPSANAPMARCPNDGTLAAPGTKFCPNCGSPMTQPQPAAAAGICPKCGTNAQGAKFCPNCGTKMEAPAPAVCPSCGAETKGAKFCPNCGAKLGG